MDEITAMNRSTDIMQVGDLVECLQGYDSNYWRPARVMRVYRNYGCGDMFDIVYMNGNEEEHGVASSVIRLLKSTSMTTHSCDIHVISSGKKWKPDWKLAMRNADEIQSTNDDIKLGRKNISKRNHIHISRSKSSSHILTDDPIITNFAPLADKCEECSMTTIYRCSLCSGAFYCTKYCQRSGWAKHKPKCTPPYKYRAVFRPLFTKESLAELTRSRANKSTLKQLTTAPIVEVIPSAPPFMEPTATSYKPTSAYIYDSSQDANKYGSALEPIYSTPVRNKPEPSTLRSAKIYPLFEEPDEDVNIRDTITDLFFTGASEVEIRRALKMHANDMNAAANWLLKTENGVTDDHDDLPELVSDTKQQQSEQMDVAVAHPVINPILANAGPYREPLCFPAIQQPIQAVTAAGRSVGWQFPDTQDEDVYQDLWGHRHRSDDDNPQLTMMSNELAGRPAAADLMEVYSDTLKVDDDRSRYPNNSLNSQVGWQGGNGTNGFKGVKAVEEVKEEDDDDEGANEDAIFGLCDMLGVSYDEARRAVLAFPDPNAAADWLISHPGEQPPQRANIYPLPPPPPHSAKQRAPTPTAPTSADSYHDELD